ncbi:MAG: hypothetical protein JWM10_3499, partial [Myxococcaceae bacterium]|nr:hypothetical protein [Myxococcaceae bacterium]
MAREEREARGRGKGLRVRCDGMVEDVSEHLGLTNFHGFERLILQPHIVGFRGVHALPFYTFQTAERRVGRRPLRGCG